MAAKHRGRGSAVTGLILVIAGLLFLLDNLDLFEVDVGEVIAHGWPLVLLAFGLKHLHERRMMSGLLLVALGVVFELRALDLLDSEVFRRWWPLLPIGVGGWLVFRAMRSGEKPVADADGALLDSADSFRVFQMWGGTRRVITSQSFRGGEATAFMGGAEIDLRQTVMAAGGARVDVTALMGSVSLLVPPGWDVVVLGSPFMGAVEDKRVPIPRPPDAPAAPRLEVRATVLAGGLEIS